MAQKCLIVQHTFNEHAIKVKALSLVQSFELTNFRTSNVLLDKWKQKRNVSFKAISGVANDVTSEVTASWKDTNQNIYQDMS